MSLEFIDDTDAIFSVEDRAIDDTIQFDVNWCKTGSDFILTREQAKAVYDHLGEQFGFHD